MISGSGLTDDVIQAREGQISNRRGRQQEAADDADQDQDDADDEGHELEDDADEDADGSNLEDGEHEDGEDEDGADESEDDADEDGRADPLEAEYTVKVNGKEAKVTAKELVAGYQRNADYHRKTQALAERGRNLTTSHQQVAEVFTRKLQQVNGLAKGIRQLLIGDINSDEMSALQRTNPQEWMVQRALLQDRIGKVDAVIQGINQENERHAHGLTEQQQRNLRATIDEERALTRKAIPDWDTDGKVRLAKYLTGSGFSEQELVNVVDHRMLTVAEKARQWDALQAAKAKAPKRKAKPATEKRPLRAAQTQLKKGANGAKDTRNREFRNAKSHARKTGDMRDAGKAITRLL